MADATFDGVNLVITLPLGQTSIDVEVDLYSAWKRWQLTAPSPSTRRFPAAFRTIGGDPLVAGLEAGAYFFLQNNEGWRIRPAEADATVAVIGNLVAEDPNVPLTTPTIGGYTVLLNGLQPVTQGTSDILLNQQDALYNGEVWIDTTGGEAGTEFPTGTASNPVDNLVDAYSILARLKVKKLVVVSSAITLDRDSTGYIFEGRGLTATVETAGFDVSNSVFNGIDVSGDFAASTGVRVTGAHSFTGTNFEGQIHDSGLGASLSLKAGVITFVRCFSLVIGTGTPVVDCQSLTVDVHFRGYHGGLEITNFDQPTNDMSIDVNAARVVLGPTITDGDIVVRGVGELENTTGGTATVNTDGFIDGQEVEIIHQMSAGNVDISLDDLTITVYKQGSITIPIATFSVSADGRVRRRLT